MQRRGTPSAFVISITPFDDDGEIDWDGTRAHWQRLKDAGIGVYVGGGGSGEGHALLEHEVDGLLALASKELVGSVPTRAMGVEPRTARQMIEFGRKVQGPRPRRDADLLARHGSPRHPAAAGAGALLPRRARAHRHAVGDLHALLRRATWCPSTSCARCAPSTRTSSGSTSRSARTSRTSCACSTKCPRTSRCTSAARCTRCPRSRWAAPASCRRRRTSSRSSRTRSCSCYGAGDYEGAADAYSKVLRVFTLLGSRVVGEGAAAGVRPARRRSPPAPHAAHHRGRHHRRPGEARRDRHPRARGIADCLRSRRHEICRKGLQKAVPDTRIEHMFVSDVTVLRSRPRAADCASVSRSRARIGRGGRRRRCRSWWSSSRGWWSERRPSCSRGG